jgi:hypothetical protein
MTRNDVPPKERWYGKVGWGNMETRNSVIRKRHKQHTTRKRYRMTVRESVVRLASAYGLSEKRIQAIIYR